LQKNNLSFTFTSLLIDIILLLYKQMKSTPWMLCKLWPIYL